MLTDFDYSSLSVGIDPVLCYKYLVLYIQGRLVRIIGSQYYLNHHLSSGLEFYGSVLYWFLANVNSRSCSLFAVARPSVVCLSVCRL